MTAGLNIPTLDELDEALLWELIRNARVTNSALAEMFSVSAATIHHRLRRLREIGVWESNHAEVNLTLLGFHVQALVSIRLKPEARSHLAEHMKRFAQKAHTMSVYVLGGPIDLLVHLNCVSTAQLHEIITREYYEDPDVGYADTQIAYAYARGAQHMEMLKDFDDLRV